MGGASNPIKQLTQNISTGIEDVSLGVTQLSRGEVDQGLWNLVAGTSNVASGGTAAVLGIQGETGPTKKRTAAEAATAAVEEQSRVELAQAQVDKRKDTIRRRIDAEIALRLKRPGRSQTLLTPGQTNLVANPTLLTGGRNNG